MQFINNYTTEAKIKSLSERFKHFCKNDEANRSFGANFKSANLQYNLSLVIAQIIFNLQFIDRSKPVFLSIIDEYNSSNNTTLTFEDFKSICWIREVNDEIVMPAGIKSFIWQVGYYTAEGKPIKIPEDKLDITKCLQLYYKRCFAETKLTITPEKVNEIVSAYGSSGLTINYLEEKSTIRLEKTHNLYTWAGGDFARYLNTEIVATLWLLCGDDNAAKNDFNKWFKLVIGTGIWVPDLTDFLSYDSLQKIRGFAFDKLLAEPDLIYSENEFKKLWLDGENYRHINVDDEIPKVDFDCSNPHNLVENIQYHKWRFQDAFDYQRTRSFCYLLIRLIINHTKEDTKPYKEIISMLKDTSRPYLLWTLFKEIPKNFPQVIPYLLDEPELITLAFKQVDKMELRSHLVSDHTQQEQQFEDACELKNNWWLEMFDYLLEQINNSIIYKNEDAGELIAKIILTVGKDTFYLRNSHRNQFTLHNAYRKRYDAVIKKLGDKKVTTYNSYPAPIENPAIITYLLPGMVNYLCTNYQSKLLQHVESISVSTGFLDVCIETLQYLTKNKYTSSTNAGQSENLKASELHLINTIAEYLTGYYLAKQIEIRTYYGTTIEKRKVRRSSNEFGFEIINWGFLYLKLFEAEAFDKLKQTVLSSISINEQAAEYDEGNREQAEKIKLWLKSLLLSYLSVQRNKKIFTAQGLETDKFLAAIEEDIAETSINYCNLRLAEGSINIFNDGYCVIGYNQYHEHLKILLFKSVNYFTHTNPVNFIRSIFTDSIDTGMMLLAINILDNPELKAIISGLIEKIDIDTFIKSTYTVTDLQYALIDAVNSDKHWHLAKPLIERIQRHYESRKMHDANSAEFFFEINLLLYFKGKDIDKIKNEKLPERQNHYSTKKDDWAINKKQFFIALHSLYNERKYDAAIRQFQALLSADEKNVRCSFHLYQAKVSNAIKENNLDVTLIISAWQAWQEFTEKPGITGSKELFKLKEQLDKNSLIYYLAVNEPENFDRTVSRLSKSVIYDEETAPLIYNYYTQRGLHELAYEYITNTSAYICKHSAIPNNINSLLDNAQSPALLTKLKLGLSQISSLKPKNISRVIPESINDKNNLDEFILDELLSALKVMKDKIHGVEQITHEDRFTDLLLASLRLRFPVWGWNITDQARTGHSASGINAGETDILIQASGKNISLVEAFILSGGDFTKTSEHILKCAGYVSYFTDYYVIVYYKGSTNNFESCWNTYKENVLKINYPASISINTDKGFEDLHNKFDNPRNICIAKSFHNSDVGIFHVMINMN